MDIHTARKESAWSYVVVRQGWLLRFVGITAASLAATAVGLWVGWELTDTNTAEEEFRIGLKFGIPAFVAFNGIGLVALVLKALVGQRDTLRSQLEKMDALSAEQSRSDAARDAAMDALLRTEKMLGEERERLLRVIDDREREVAHLRADVTASHRPISPDDQAKAMRNALDMLLIRAERAADANGPDASRTDMQRLMSKLVDVARLGLCDEPRREIENSLYHLSNEPELERQARGTFSYLRTSIVPKIVGESIAPHFDALGLAEEVRRARDQ